MAWHCEGLSGTTKLVRDTLFLWVELVAQTWRGAHIPTLDPLDFDQKCDGSLPLETMIKPDPELRKLMQDIDRSKTRVWALTNAYRTVRAIVCPSSINV